MSLICGENSYAYSHSPIEFYFKQSPRDFVVEEVPLYVFNGSGPHTILKMRKKDLTTFQMLKILSSSLGVKEIDIGYAGLKDKNALTIQHISIPCQFEKLVENFSHEKIKILDITRHQNKLKIGHLKGNRFFIRIKKLNKINNIKITQVLNEISKYGIPNYFGYQRFGIDGDNYKLGQDIVNNKARIKNKKMSNFLISAYQSYLFNAWLSLRINFSKIVDCYKVNEIYDALFELLQKNNIGESFKDKDIFSKIKAQEHIFKVLPGESMCHYPYGRHFILDDIINDSNRFLNKDISVLGALSGKKLELSHDMALFFEDLFLDSKITSVGSRRYAWVFLDDVQYNYKEEEAQGKLNFYLPKGSYATTLLRELARRELDCSETIKEDCYV